VVAEGASDATFDAIPAEAGTAPGTPIVTATRDAEMVADDAPVATAPSAVPSTVAAPAGPAAVEIHEIRMETAGPAVAPSGDSAQMIGELRAATPASVTPATIPGSQDAADVVPVQPLPRAAMTKAAVHPVAADPSGLEAQSALTASGVDATALQRAASQPAESSPVASVSADVVTTTAVRSGGPSPGRNVEQMPSPETEAGVTAAQGQAAISAYRASEQGSDGGDTRDRSEQQHESASAVSAVSKAVAGSVSEQVGVTATFTVPGATTDGALQAASGTGETVRSDAAPVTPRDTAHNVQTMVRSARLHFSEGGGEARLQLQPEHLGPVTLTVRVEQGRVSAHIQADTVDASRWIETHQQELRGALRDQGLDVKEVVVTTNPDGRREREAPHARPQAARRRQNADAPRVEVVV
jgi:flagellar hook-length control protein FliK